MTTAQRNNAIKKLLEKEYGKGKVWVRGSRGTAYGWVNVYIDLGIEQSFSYREQYAKASKLIADAADIKIGTYGYDDPGSDYGYGRKINFTFEPPYDVRQKASAA
jgi:hypothetical protein